MDNSSRSWNFESKQDHRSGQTAGRKIDPETPRAILSAAV
jgi:hypothetical protein